MLGRSIVWRRSRALWSASLRSDFNALDPFSLTIVPTQFVAVGQFDDVPLVQPLDLVGDRVVLLALGAVDHVGMVDPLQRPVGGNGDHVELVDLPELAGLGHGRAGHAADLVVELEEVLQRDRGQRLVLFLDLHAFLGLDRLVQPVAPVAALHQAAGELVDDDDLAVLDHVVDVALVEMMGLQRIVDQVRPFHVAGGVEALDAGQSFRPPARLRRSGGPYAPFP